MAPFLLPLPLSTGSLVSTHLHTYPIWNLSGVLSLISFIPLAQACDSQPDVPSSPLRNLGYFPSLGVLTSLLQSIRRKVSTKFMYALLHSSLLSYLLLAQALVIWKLRLLLHIWYLLTYDSCCQQIIMLNFDHESREMAQWVEASTAMPDDLSSISAIHMVGGENRVSKVVL